MYKAVSVVIASIVFSGCAMTTKWDSSYEEYEKMQEAPELDVQLTTDQIPGFFQSKIQHQLEIFVDGNLALEAPIHSDYSGSIMFFYSGDRFELECLKPNFWSYSECSVAINGRRAGKVKFGV